MNPITILDGAMGTELQRRGYKTTLPLWSASANLDAPELVKKIHEDYVQAGADIITTNTFRTNIRAWKKVGRSQEAKKATEEAVKIALSVKKKHPHIRIAGSITTLEDCYEPHNVPQQEELEKEHGLQVSLFKNLGIDLFLLETFNTIREAKTVLTLASKTEIPSYISIITNKDGNLLSGESLIDFVSEVSLLKPQAILLNCRPPDVLTKAARKLSQVYKGIKGMYANGQGQPADGLGWSFKKKFSPKEYLQFAKEWKNLGFTIIGGCCGTSPEYITILSRDLNLNKNTL